MTARRAAGLASLVAAGALVGVGVHAAGEDPSFRPLPLLAEVAAGVAIGLVVWVGALVLRRDEA